MEGKDKTVEERIVDARAAKINHNVRCTECGSQSIEDSQADVAILLRKFVRQQIKEGLSDKDIYKKLEEDFGDTVLYTPKFDSQTAVIWLSPLIVGGAIGGMYAYRKRRQKTNVQLLTRNLVKSIPLTPNEKKTILDILTPPPSEATPLSYWWRRFFPR